MPLNKTAYGGDAFASPPHCFYRLCTLPLIGNTASGSFLNLNEVPSTGLGIDGLDVSAVTVCIAGLIKFNVTAYAFIGNAGKSCHNCCGICRACRLDSLKSYHVCVIAHDGNCGKHVVAAVVFKILGIGIDPLLDALFKFGVCTFLIEGGNIDVDILALCNLKDGVGIPCIGTEDGDVDALCGCLVDDKLCVGNGNGSKDRLNAFLLGVVHVRGEVSVLGGEYVLDDFNAELVCLLLEVVDKTCAVVVAVFAQAVDLIGVKLILCKACKNGTLERVGEADAEVVAVALGDLRIGAGYAQCGYAGLFKGLGSCYCLT